MKNFNYLLLLILLFSCRTSRSLEMEEQDLSVRVDEFIEKHNSLLFEYLTLTMPDMEYEFVVDPNDSTQIIVKSFPKEVSDEDLEQGLKVMEEMEQMKWNYFHLYQETRVVIEKRRKQNKTSSEGFKKLQKSFEMMSNIYD